MSNIGNNHRLLDLRARLKNPPQFWNGEDVVAWLGYIGLEQYAPTFAQLKIDGYLILDLTEEDLEGELQVSVKLHRKKLMKAIQELKLLEHVEPGSKDRGVMPPTGGEMTNVQSRTRLLEPAPPLPGVSRREHAGDVPHIYIVSLEGPVDIDYPVRSEAVNIGRHSTNQISISDESVSRQHARVEFDGTRCTLCDIGSTTGTFIKIQEPIQLREEMIIEVGSYQFMVAYVHIARMDDYSGEESHIEIAVHESPDGANDKYILYSGNSIGRKGSCTLSFGDDLHMSNLHCKFNLVGDRFIFEDMASTNGSWLRLSREGVRSEPYPLDRAVVFKIGNTAMYEVRVAHRNANEETLAAVSDRAPPGEKCSICWDNERDCLLMPCRHNVTCTKCVKSVKQCPFCREQIKDIIKIYK